MWLDKEYPMANKLSYEMTYDEIAQALGISRERVRQILKSAMKKIKQNKKLRAYYLGEQK